MDYFKGIGSLAGTDFGGAFGVEPEKPVERPNAPGLMSDVRRASGQFVSGVGSTLRDIGAQDVGSAIEQYGTGVVQRNPSEIRSFEDVLSRPFTTAREAVGEVAPQVGLAIGGQLAGRLVGGALGLPFGPGGVAVGQQIGGFVGGLLPTAAQTYGGIRTEQREKGIDERGRALAVTIPAALLERFGGAERVALRVAGEGTEFLQRAAGTGFAKNVGKQFVRGGAEELITEIPQTGLERYGVTGETADLTSPEALSEYGVAGAKAFLGGGTVRAGLSSLAGTRKEPTVTIQPDGTITSDQPVTGDQGETDLTGGSNVLMTPEQAAQRLQDVQGRRPAPLADTAFEPLPAQRGLFDTRGGEAPPAPVAGEQLDLFGGGGQMEVPTVDERQGDLFAPAEPTFQTRITAGLLDSLGLPRQSSMYRQLLGKDMADPAQQPQIAELFDRVRADANISERTKAGVEGLAMQAFGGLAQQQEMFGPRGGAYPRGRPSTQQDAPGPIENILPTAPLGATQAAAPVVAPMIAPAESTTADTTAAPAPVAAPVAAPEVPAGVELTAEESRAVKQAKAVFDIAETDADRRNVSAIMQRIIDRAAQRSGTTVTPPGAPTAVAAVLPAATGAAGVSSTVTTGAPSGNQAPQAKQAKAQGQKAPVTAGSVVKVNDTEVTLDEKQAAAWNAAQESYDGKVRRAKALTNYQERDSALRAAGMQLSAERRKITGALTAKEQEAAGPKNVAEAIKEDNEIDRVLKAVEAEDDKTDKLFATVTGDTKKAPGKPSMPTQVYAAIRNAILNPGKAVVVRKAKSVEKDAAATEKYGAKAKRIADAAREFAAAYEAYASQNLVRSGEVIKRDQTADDVVASRATQLKANAAAVQRALAKLGEAVEGNAKDVEAVVRFVKDRAQKEKRGDVKTEKADITLSRAWTAAKSESFMGEPDLLATTGAEVRQSREAAAKGATPQLVEAATEGYKVMGKGEAQKGLNGILNYIRTVGTPFEKTLAQAIKLAVAGKAPINIKFVKEGTSQYDPKTNTITINETSSKEVALHEALHGALQWFVYTNPNAAQVVALKTALQRVVNYDGKLPPKAAEVQALLKKILAGKSKTAELDAVLELVSYGNTLNDFRRALQAMESNAPRTFTKFANDVMDAIYALVRRMLGSNQTVASDVMENTFQLLEAARAATQETAPKKGNVLQAAAQSNGLVARVRGALRKLGVATSSVNSNGQPLASTDVATRNFWKWFGDSEVVDRQGRPLVVYHGTTRDFDTFDENVEKNLLPAKNLKGFYFSARPEDASTYAIAPAIRSENNRSVAPDARVMPVYLRIENPLYLKEGDTRGAVIRPEFAEELRKKGYDGIIYADGKEIVVFDAAQVKSAIGNRGTFDPTSGNILKAEVTSLDAAAKEAGWADASAFANGPGAFKTPTQIAFELIGLGRVNGKDLPITAMIKETGAKTAEYIRKNVPTLERMILNFNSKFSNGALVNDLIERFKYMQNTGYLQMERIAQHLASHPELAKPFLDFMDGNDKALDGVKNGAAFKAIAENLQTLMKQYIDSLPTNSPERRAFQNVKFSQYLLHPDSIGQVAGTTFGVKKLASMLGVERRGETSLDEFKDWLMEDADGRIDLDDPLYQVFEDKGGQTIPFGFISIEKYNNGLIPAGVKVATDRIWKMSQYKEGAFQFTSSKATVSEAKSVLKTEELSAALLNTTAALAHTFASRNFLSGIANIGRNNGEATSGSVAFNNVEELNAAFPEARISKEKLLEVSDESSRSPQIRWRAQRTGVWVKLPDSETYGPLAGKIIPGPVWNSMLDMHDRAPLVNIQAFNDVMAFFKKSKTVYNPGTHVTNILSNITLSILHGITPSTMGRAAKMFLDFERNPDSMRKEDLALMKAFYASGAVLGQFSSTEVKKTVYDKLNQAITPDSDSSYLTKLNSFSKYERLKAQLAKYDNMASEIYAAEDNVFRLAAFLNTAGNIQVRDGSKTLSAEQLEEAGLAGRKLFLDYDIDARAIRAMRQSFMPFISWSYAIMPVLGRIAIEKPWAMANVLMTYALMQAALSGDDEEEKRKVAPEQLRERAWGGLGPYMHMRLPFLGDNQNPVYFNLGKYIPMFTLFQPPPGESKLAGQEWVPGFLTPSGPLTTLMSALSGFDPFTGKPMHDPTDTQWDKLVNTGKAVYNTMAPAAVNATFWKNTIDLGAGVTGPTGVEKSALFLARNLGGLGLYQFNVDESAFYQRKEVKRIKREFDTAIAKAKRLEYSKGYPDYEALDAELNDLRTRMQEEIAKARGEE